MGDLEARSWTSVLPPEVRDLFVNPGENAWLGSLDFVEKLLAEAEKRDAEQAAGMAVAMDAAEKLMVAEPVVVAA